jgi:hypothetical protein
MGRYYSGDIEGKFWFGVQNSNAADRFGVTGYQPERIEYSYSEDDLGGINKEIKVIEDSLGALREMFDKFFLPDGAGYNTEKLLKFFKTNGHTLTEKELDKHLSDYADLGLGIQIRDCIVEEGYCSFDGEY